MGKLDFFLSARQVTDEVIKKPLTSNFRVYQIQKNTNVYYYTCTICIEAQESH